MAEDVEQFIRDEELEKPALIGHSMGAKVAMTVALRQPDLISALIPVDNAPVDAALKSDFSRYVEGMLAVESAHVTSSKEADWILQPYEPQSLTIRNFLLANLVRPRAQPKAHGEGTSQSWMTFSIPLQTLAKSLAEGHLADFPFKTSEDRRRRYTFKGPTLIVRGTKSHYVPDEFLPAIGEFFPRFELLDLDTGHWVISEDMEGFRKGVVDWFARIGDGEDES